MILALLHTITGIIATLALVAKISLHYYLNYAMGRSGGISSFLFAKMQYFRPYKPDVTEKLIPAKQLCNLSFWVAFISLVVNFVAGLLIYLA